MQLKGLIRFFAVALILISLYQLHFTLVVRNHENSMEKKAKSHVSANYSTSTPEVKDFEFKKKLRRLLDSTREKTLTYGLTGAISYRNWKA
jgi:SecD/SecF fusion protein